MSNFEFQLKRIGTLKRYLVFALAINLTFSFFSDLISAGDHPPLPDPDGQPASDHLPIKVFILLGQSNMLGFGRIDPHDKSGTLSNLVKEQQKYPHLIDADGQWTTRKDVRNVHVMDKRGVDFRDLTTFADMKNEWLTVNKGHIGPELQFGHIMGHVHEAPVLILKACIGNRSLGWDLLPPGSERFEFEGKTYAGYKDNPLSWVEGEPKKEVALYAGRQYDADTSHAKEVLKNLEKYYPGYKGQGYEISGFVFWQGHKDQNPAHASRYEQNLVRFIKTLRKDFHAPNAKFVLATIGFEGSNLSGHGLTIANAQLAVSGETGNYPDFSSNVKTIDARPFWRDQSVSPSGAGYHYNHNAETYMEVGNALGWAMAGLLEEWKVSAPPTELNLPEFYQKYVSAGGYPVVSSGKVNDYALKEAAYLIHMMLAHRPDIKEAMIKSGSRMIVMAHDEFTTEVPEHSKLEPKEYWDARARGLGGSRRDPVCSCGEENLLAYQGDPYATENILIHEFAHNIHYRGMDRLDDTFDDRLKKAYEAAMKAGLWEGKYASVNHAEYFAEGVQSWFDNNRPPDHDHNHVDTRAELLEYDPGLAALCAEVFGETELVYTKPTTRLHGHLEGYDPSKAPRFTWPESFQEVQREIRAKAESRGTSQK